MQEDSRDLLLFHLKQLHDVMRDFREEERKRFDKLEARLFGNGQPGIVTKLDHRIEVLEDDRRQVTAALKIIRFLTADFRGILLLAMYLVATLMGGVNVLIDGIIGIGR